MDISIQIDNQWVVVKLNGSLVASTCEELKGQMTKLMGRNYLHFILDMEQVEFMDSSGLGSCIALNRESAGKGGKIVCCNLKDNVRKIFQMTRADQKVSVVGDAMEASKLVMDHIIQKK